jgi:L-rhamnose mutarotase
MKKRTWKIIAWDSNDKEYDGYVEYPLLKDVINYLKESGVYKYSIFDDKGMNVSNDGVSPLNKMMT